MPSFLWQVRAGLVDAFAPPAKAARAVLFDGPRPRGGDTPPLFLVVGADSADPFEAPETVEDTLAGTSRQEWSPMGPGTWRVERGTVLCTAVAWSGDVEFAPLRETVEALVDSCEAVLLDDPSLGGVVGAGVELAEVAVWQRRTPKGSAVGAVLTVAYEAELVAT